MLEAQQEVLRRVANDLLEASRHAGDRTELFVKMKNGIIDFNAYLREYIEELAEAEAKKPVEEKVPGRILQQDDDSPIIFGGDTP